MRQFVLPSSYQGQQEITLKDEAYRYLIIVLRLNAHDSFPGVDRDGNRYQITIRAIEEKSCRVSIRKQSDAALRGPKITLFQCLPKGRKIETILRQSTEAGVYAVYPVESEHSLPETGKMNIETKKKRWQKIVEEAVQQSGSTRITKVGNPISIYDVPSVGEKDCLGMFFHQERISNHTLHGVLAGKPTQISLIVGPEGGLCEQEVKFLCENGFIPIYLKTNILRVETAVLYAISAVQTILMERESWKLCL